MSQKYSAEDLAEMQTTLVQEYLEIAADASREAHPDSLRICAMLLAGSAELVDPPAAPEPEQEPEPVPSSTVYDAAADAAALDELLPEIPEEPHPTPEELSEALSANSPYISFDGSRPTLPTDSLIEATTPPYKTPAEYLNEYWSERIAETQAQVALPKNDYDRALEYISFVRNVLNLAGESSRHIEKTTLTECGFQLSMAERYLNKKDQWVL